MLKGLKVFLISIAVVGAIFSFCWFIGALGWVADGKLPTWLETKLEGISIRGNFALVSTVGANNPTYEELVDFIREDKTNEKPYKAREYNCMNYATDVHNNAEASGIRAGYVVINPNRKTYPFGHALNVFDTIDEGLVFIDCTGYDTRAYVSIGESYAIEPLYPGAAEGFLYTWVGTVEEYIIYWW